MKIGIIGAGFTGLSAALKLQKNGHKVTIFEKENQPGGLAFGFKDKEWNWTLEKHYHHFFTNDKSMIKLTKEIGFKTITNRPKTSVYIDGRIIQLDSPKNVLLFNNLDILDRLRMAATLGFLRYNPFWHSFEGIKAVDFLSKAMGKKAYEMVWEPQIRGKFQDHADLISLAWFWARIKKRTTNLIYPKEGFLKLAEEMTKQIKKNKGEVMLNSEVVKIYDNNKIIIYDNNINKELNFQFDKIIVTLPTYYFLKITPNLPSDYKIKLAKLESIGAISLILRLKKPFFSDKTYWLSICEKEFPFLAVVEHTNFIDKKHYNNEHIIYIGKYLKTSHPYFSKSKKELLEIYDPFLKKINKHYKTKIIESHLFKDAFAQPIIPINYSKIIPPIITPIKNLYLANIQQVYPWDRGTNYAVELGEKVADVIINHEN